MPSGSLTLRAQIARDRTAERAEERFEAAGVAGLRPFDRVGKLVRRGHHRVSARIRTLLESGVDARDASHQVVQGRLTCSDQRTMLVSGRLRAARGEGGRRGSVRGFGDEGGGGHAQGCIGSRRGGGSDRVLGTRRKARGSVNARRGAPHELAGVGPNPPPERGSFPPRPEARQEIELLRLHLHRPLGTGGNGRRRPRLRRGSVGG